MKYLKTSQELNESQENLNISDIISSLLKEMNERLQYLKTQEKSDENEGRILELTNCIVRVQQIGLNYL